MLGRGTGEACLRAQYARLAHDYAFGSNPPYTVTQVTRLPQPSGPFVLLEGAEYAAARSEANQANRALHAADPSLDGLQVHEIQSNSEGAPLIQRTRLRLRRRNIPK
jgi:hypothetical protein